MNKQILIFDNIDNEKLFYYSKYPFDISSVDIDENNDTWKASFG